MTETITIERTDTTSLDDLEFEPSCCIQFIGLDGKFPKCENPAKWIGYAPCCGFPALVCEYHFEHRHERPFICNRCKGVKGVHNDLMDWRRL